MGWLPVRRVKALGAPSWLIDRRFFFLQGHSLYHFDQGSLAASMMLRVAVVSQYPVYSPSQRDLGDLVPPPSIVRVYRHRADMLCATDAGIEIRAAVATGPCYHWE